MLAFLNGYVGKRPVIALDLPNSGESDKILDPAEITIAAYARYAAAAIALTVAEAALPLPLPGVEPGFANIVVLIVLEATGLVVWQRRHPDSPLGSPNVARILTFVGAGGSLVVAMIFHRRPDSAPLILARVSRWRVRFSATKICT